MNEKTLLRIGSVGVSLMLVMLAITVHNSMQMLTYRRQLENNYRHSIQEVTSQVNAITVDLQKYNYAGTPAQLSAISAQVWKNAGTAKAALASLPVQEMDLEETYRFLSQVGDYAMYLSRKSARGEVITDEERENLERLIDYAQMLSNQLSETQYRVGNGEIQIDKLLQGEGQGPFGVPEAAVAVDWSGMQIQPEGYPTLIYDGPFSDHMLERFPAMLEGEKKADLEDARYKAAFYAELAVEQMEQGTDEESHMPCYTFTAGNVEVGVTKAGGHVAYLVSGREIGPGQMSIEQALENARAYLDLREIEAMQQTYYELSGGILTINYAYMPEDVICYTDLIKVGVAMDNGQVVFYDARGFLNNHKDRELPQTELAEEEASASVSPRLHVRGCRLALIPTAGNHETLAYEFACTGQNGEDVLVYINTSNGAEEQIFILIENENGTLAV